MLLRPRPRSCCRRSCPPPPLVQPTVSAAVGAARHPTEMNWLTREERGADTSKSDWQWRGGPQGGMTIVRTHRASLRITLVVAMLAGLLSAIGASAAGQAALVAHGSAKQVYATGLAPNAKVALLDRSGHRVATKNATSLGGVVFYGVKPGSGYR